MLKYSIYTHDMANIEISDSFFAGWPNPPSKVVHRKILTESYRSIVCIDDTSSTIVGFINAVSDGILSAYIPLLEVIPSYQGQGIGKELVRLMTNELSNLYMIDLLCDQPLQGYYETLGMIPSQGMILRNYTHQNGEINDRLETEKEELRQLENKFCEDVASQGAEGWSKYFAKSGCMLTKNGTPIEGNESIKTAMTPFFALQNLIFKWEPTHIDISNDATLAVTYGKYKRTYNTKDEYVEETGMYMTIWKKQSDGTWKISADIGN